MGFVGALLLMVNLYPLLSLQNITESPSVTEREVVKDPRVK